jgi:hypothetical protein
MLPLQEILRPKFLLIDGLQDDRNWFQLGMLAA